jgi:hypothetical protein
MADLKISQLPEATSLLVGDIFPIVNDSLTKKVSVANLSNSLPITTFVRGASAGWGGGLIAAQYAFSGPYIPGVLNDNLTNNTDNFPRWNTQVFNTDSNTFELVNSNTTLSRVFIKAPGYYQIISQPHYFDLYGNMQITVKLFNSVTSSGGMAYVLRLASRWFVGTLIPPSQTIDSSAVFFVPVPGYYTVSLNPSLNTPYPSSDGALPSRFTLIKLLAS